jgi:hypothetical protein
MSAVTVAGALVLVAGLGVAVITVLSALGSGVPANAEMHAGLAVTFLVLVFVGWAMIRRWRGWRIWSGTLAWGLVAMTILGLFASPEIASATSWTTRMVVIACAAAILLAKRLERSESQ